MTTTEQEAPVEMPSTVGIKNLTVKDGVEAIDTVKEFVTSIGADSVEVTRAEIRDSSIVVSFATPEQCGTFREKVEAHKQSRIAAGDSEDVLVTIDENSGTQSEHADGDKTMEDGGEQTKEEPKDAKDEVFVDYSQLPTVWEHAPEFQWRTVTSSDDRRVLIMRNIVPADIYEPPLYIAAQRALTVEFKYDRPKAHQTNRDLNIFRYGQLKLTYANDNVLMRAALDHLVMLRVPHRQVHILIPDTAQTRKQSETLTQRLGKVRVEYPPAFRTLLLRGVPEWANEEHVRTALHRLCEHDEYTVEFKKDAVGRNCTLVEFVDVRAAIKTHALLGDVRLVNTEAAEGASEHESTTKAAEEKTTAGSIAAETKPQSAEETVVSDKAADAKKVNVRAFLMCQGYKFRTLLTETEWRNENNVPKAEKKAANKQQKQTGTNKKSNTLSQKPKTNQRSNRGGGNRGPPPKMARRYPPSNVFTSPASGPRNPYPLAAFNSAPQPPVRPPMSPWQRHEPVPSVAGYGGADINVQERLNRQEHMINQLMTELHGTRGGRGGGVVGSGGGYNSYSGPSGVGGRQSWQQQGNWQQPQGGGYQQQRRYFPRKS